MSPPLLLICLVAAPLWAQDPVLGRWLEAWQRGAPIDAHGAAACAARLQDAFRALSDGQGDPSTVWAQALDVIALDPGPASNRGSELAPFETLPSDADAPVTSLAATARRLLQAHPPAIDWLVADVLPGETRHPAARRVAALRTALDTPPAELTTALLVIARSEADPLRPTALTALASWTARFGPERAIDQLLVTLLIRADHANASPHPFGLLQQRLAVAGVPLAPRAADLLSEHLPLLLRSSDWRQAARAVQLLRGMELERSVPMLLDALSAWSRRAADGRGSRRIESDLVHELERLSGRRLGANPTQWINWWVAVRQGRIDAAATPTEGDEPRSKASFFGLRPTTQRVTFVVDHSGSMSTGFGTRDVTRYEEAIGQMTRFLQASGPETRFNVVLFDSAPLRSSTQLVPATPEMLERARASMLARSPEGGTMLEPAVRLALCVGEGGEVDLAELEADTIIVLCDGENSDGDAWVRPLLERVQPAAQVRFHCVQIGTSGGEALRELAARTGGEFLRISG